MRPRRILLFAFALSGVWFTGFFPPANNPNELSRIEAVVAFVEHGTFSIDAVIPRLGDTMDKSVWNGRFYSNKAPGLIFAGVAVYRLLRVFFLQPAVGTSMVFALMRLVTVTLAGLIALARLTRRLEEDPGRRRAAALVVFAAAFGTPFATYARTFFSHAWTASLLFLAWDLVRSSGEPRRRQARWLVLAGFVAGWAAISEYTVAPIALALALRAAWSASGSRIRALLQFGAGAAPPLLLLGAYDAICFGSPVRLSSACEAFPEYAVLAHSAFFGLGLPRPGAAWATLFSNTRGVLLFSPFLAWAAAGWLRWWRAGRDRADAAFVLAAVFLMWLPITGYPNWDGGWSLGMRYLLPAVLLAVLPIPWALATPLSRGLFLAAVSFSAVLHVLAGFSWPHFPASIAWPAASVSAWLVVHGAVAPSLGGLLGWPAAICLLPPLAAVLSAFTAVVRELPPSRPGRAVACALGAALFGVTLLKPPAMSSADLAWRERTAQKLKDNAVPRL